MKKFKRIYIEIINTCNLSCSFCPPTSRGAASMTVADFSHVLHEIKPYTDYIYLHVKGEPLIHKDLESILKLCEDNHLNTTITTNGMLLKQVAPILFAAKSLRQVNISLHSFEANQLSRSFEDYLDDCLRFSDQLSEQTKAIAALRLWNLDIDKIGVSQRSRNEDILEAIEKYFYIKEPLKSILTPSMGVKIKKQVYLNYAQEFDWPSLNAPFVSSSGSCHGLRDQVAILVDGTVVPCCLDNNGDINLGNVFKESFIDILEKQRSRDIITGFQNHKLLEPLCQHCGYRTRF